MSEPLCSIFTPVHPASSPFIQEAYYSIREQGYKNLEWVVVPNGGLQSDNPALKFKDSWVRICPVQDDPKGNKVGRLKKVAASLGAGEILLELDADDILSPLCVEKIVQAFEDPSVQFVAANEARFRNDTFQPEVFSEHWGWKHRVYSFGNQGHQSIWTTSTPNDGTFIEMVNFPPSPHAYRRIEYSPDHPRAWRRSAYQELGGHDEKLSSADDHDLMARTYIKYGAKGIRHLDEILYRYRVHQSTSIIRNDEVQRQVARNYLKYIYPLAEKWADDNGLYKVDLGGGIDPQPGFDVADLTTGTDLNDPWPYPDNSVGIFRAYHCLEHLKDSIHSFNEAYRCLTHGGFFFIEVPSTDGWGAHCDPTHISFFNLRSFRYYVDKALARYIPTYKGRFQVSRIEQYLMEPNVPVIACELMAVKHGPRLPGELLI